jgi:predicted transposase/invertase (TIGR01784 family)
MLTDKYINLFTDFGFKKIFGTESNKDLLIDFLNTILENEIPKIKDLKYLKTEFVGKVAKERKAIFDLFCENERGEKFIIELQRAEQEFFKDRSIYYASFPIQEQGKKGKDWDYELLPVYTISIMNFVFSDQYPDKIISYIELRDRETNTLFFDKLHFVYLEMPKFQKKLSELKSNTDKWLYVFKNMHLLDNMPDEVKQGVFLKLFKQCEIAQYNPKELMKYQQSWKEHNDMFAVLKNAENKGVEKGIGIGVEKGIGIGVEKTAINAIKKGFDDQTIQELTGLSFEQIAEIRKKINL